MDQKTFRIAVDLDGVIAKHALGGFWLKLRKIKEKTLKKTHLTTYYYPSTFIEKTAWKVINGLRRPTLDKNGLFLSLAQKKEVRFFLITSRFKFLEKLTHNWLKHHRLDSLFYKVLINTPNINPLVFKEQMIKKFNIDYVIDDDLEVIDYLKKRTAAKFYWVVPPYQKQTENKDKKIIICTDFLEALQKIFKPFGHNF
jgi:hypothetical protein